ncbi:MAG: RHS repeat-associated core domain-containing protein [Polyangiales bacterium]
MEANLRHSADGGSADSGLAAHDASSVAPVPESGAEEEHVGSSTSALVTTGTPISTCAQLQAMENNLAAQYYLTGDIACSGHDVGDGYGFRPIGLKSKKPFTGRLYGNQHVIRNLYIARSSTTNVGLFYAMSGAVLQEVRIEQAFVWGASAAGIVAGTATNANLYQVTVNGAVVAGNTVGAFFGSTTGGYLNLGIADQVTLNTSAWPLGVIAGSVSGGTWTDTFGVVTPLNGWTAGIYGNVNTAPSLTRVYYDCTKAGTCGTATGRTTSQLQSFSGFYSLYMNAVLSNWGSRGWNQYSCLWWEPGCAVWPECCGGCGRWSAAPTPSTATGAPALSPAQCGTGECRRNAFWQCAPYAQLSSTYVWSYACTQGSPTTDNQCDGRDQNCDGANDNQYAPRTVSCGTGYCYNTATTSCVNGVENTSCTPKAPSTTPDTNCNGIDEDCVGGVDDKYQPTATTCQPSGAAAGACVAQGQLKCKSGKLEDSCVPPTMSSSDTTCNGVDDNCNGLVDDGYVGAATSCQPAGAPANVCVSTGAMVCQNGQPVNSCVAQTPASSDATCNGVDDDCSGAADEDYVPVATTCQPQGAAPGACVSTGTLTCQAGGLVDTCTPILPSNEVCNDIDDDCDGRIDEDYVCPDQTPPGWAEVTFDAAPSSTSPTTTLELAFDGARDDRGVAGYHVYVDHVLHASLPATPTNGTIHDLSPGTSYFVSVQAFDAAGNESVDGPGKWVETQTASPIPDPRTNAPAIDPSTNPTFADRFGFLYSGPNRVQSAADSALRPDEVAVITGRVVKRGGGALAGVTISAPEHPEYGQVLTRADGTYEFAVNGNLAVVLRYDRSDRLTAERTFDVHHHEWVAAEDVVMIGMSTVSGTVTTGSSAPQWVQSGTESDGDGSRHATIAFPPATTAQAVLPNGTRQSLGSLTVRATEYTVGDDGRNALPGSMPDRIGIQYAAEFTVDEARALNATSVEFSQPVDVYLDGAFLGFPVGAVVPVGSYDSTLHAWVGAPDGTVIKILAITNGVAMIDVNGDGVADSDADCEARGLSVADRTNLAQSSSGRSVGDVLVHFEASHFTPYDLNWLEGKPCPDGEECNPPTGTEDSSTQLSCDEGGNPTGNGSILDCNLRSLSEQLPVEGTDVALRYNSSHTPSYRAAYRVRFPVQHKVTPSAAYRFTTTTVIVAGQKTGWSHGMPESADLATGLYPGLELVGDMYYRSFEWDGKDAYGRPVTGPTEALITTCKWFKPETLVAMVGGSGTGRRTTFGGMVYDGQLLHGDLRQVSIFPICSSSRVMLGSRDATQTGLLGLDVEGLGRFDASTHMITYPEGWDQLADDMQATREVGGGTTQKATDVAALSAQLSNGSSYAFAADGSLYLLTGDGLYRTVGGTGVAGSLHRLIPQAYNGGGTWTQTTTLANARISQNPIAVVALRDGRVVWAEVGGTPFASFLRVYDPSRNEVRLLGGNPSDNGSGNWAGETDASVGDGGPVAQARFSGHLRLFATDDGTIFVWDLDQGRLRQISTSGIIQTVVGGPNAPALVGGAPARAGGFAKLAVSLEGRILATANSGHVYELYRSSTWKRLTGGRDAAHPDVCTQYGDPRPVEGQLLSSTCFWGSEEIAYGDNGRFVIGAQGVLYQIDEAGVVHRIAGDSTSPDQFVGNLEGKNLDRTYVKTNLVWTNLTIAVGPDQGLYTMRQGSSGAVLNRISLRRVVNGETTIPRGNRLEVYSSSGQHLRTLDATTGRILRSFSYTTDGKLASITDPSGTTTITRPSGSVVQLQGPFGHMTTLTDTNGDGWVDTLVRGRGSIQRTSSFGYVSGTNLLETLVDPDGIAHAHEYDVATGFILRDRRLTGVGGTTVYEKRLETQGVQFGTQPATTCAVTDPDPSCDLVSQSTVRTATATVSYVSNGRTTQRITRRHEGGTIERTDVAPDGTSTTTWHAPFQAHKTRSSDGTVTIVRELPHPVYGWQARYPGKITTILPSGASIVVQQRIVGTAASDGLPQTLTSRTNIGGTLNTDGITFSGGRTWTSTFDRTARTVVTTSPEGRTTTTTFDASWRPITQASPGLDSVTTTYDGHDRVTSIGDGTRTTSFDFTEAYTGASGTVSLADVGALRRVTRADGSLVRYELDDLGRTIGIRAGVTAQTPEAGQVIGLGYDALDRTTSVTPPERSSHGFVIDEWGGVGSYVPPAVSGVAHPETATVRGGDGEVVRTELPYQSGSAPTNTAAYDPTTGRFTSPYVTVDGRSGSFVPRYDSVGRIDRWTTPEGNSVTIGFDGARVKSSTWAGAVAGSVTYGYTDTRLTSLTLAGGTGASTVVNIGYDNDDQLTSVGTSANPMTIYRTPNAMGANDPLPTDSMTANNGLLRGTSIGSVRSSMRWITRGLPSAEATTWNDGTARRYGFDYQYDDLGRISTRNTYEDSTSPTHADVYGYDAYGRLQSVTRDGVEVEHYGYDANGNRTSATVLGRASVTAEQVVVDAQDRMLQYGGVSYTYNPLGQRQTRSESGATTSYTYDALGNLLAVDLPGGTTNELTYVVDAAGRRIARKKNGTLDRAWLYQNGLEPVAELDGTGAITAVFVYGTKPHVPDLVIRGGVTYRVITDHLGSVRRLVNTSNGAVAQAFEYDAWGRITSSSCNGVASCEDLQPFRYAGGLYDRDTGLTRFGARDYDAEIGRWTAKDPIGFEGGDSNVYAYVGGDPVNDIDPTGLKCSYWQRVLRNFRETNELIPGKLAPPLTGLITGKALAEFLGIPSYGGVIVRAGQTAFAFGETAANAYGGLGAVAAASAEGGAVGAVAAVGAGGGPLAVAGLGAAHLFANFLLAGAAFESGVFVGSMLAAALPFGPNGWGSSASDGECDGTCGS